MSDGPPESGALIDEILGGNKAAFRKLVEQNQRLVSHIIFRMVADRQDREDLCQEVFVRVYRNLREFRREAKLSTWIARIAYNIGLSHMKRKNIPLVEEAILDHVESDGDIPRMSSPHVDVEQKIISGLVQDEIERLPVYYKTALTLYHLDGMSYDEIVDIMKVPEGTVKSYIFRGRKMLKERLLARYSREDLWN
jgi:RNA polymerase sigma-70 factor (ECF subfamily)